MRLCPALVACLLVAAPHSALAADIRLAWNNCDGDGGLHTIMFDCNTNSSAQAHTLVASFTAPPGITQYISNEAHILVMTSSGLTPPLPDWWAIKGAGQCRNGAATADANFTAGPFGCTDVWSGAASGALATFNVGYLSPSWGRMNLVFAVPAENAVPLVEGQEYYAFKVTIQNDKTVGSGSCAGCSTPVALYLARLVVIQTSGAPGGNVALDTGQTTYRSVAGWQCPAFVGVECPLGRTCNFDVHPDCSTPTRPSTWGMIKAIYH